jgi:hypothetical protein
MEKLVEAYLEKERIIKEQAEAIMKLQSELSNLEAKLKEEKEVNDWSKRIAYKIFYGKAITKEDREKGERFKSRLVGYQTPEYTRFTDPPAPHKFDPVLAEEVDKKFRETVG